MTKGWRQTSARATARKGNSPFKFMLEGLKFPRTDNGYLKLWLNERCKRVEYNQESVVVTIEDKMIVCKTIAEMVWTLYVKHGIR